MKKISLSDVLPHFVAVVVFLLVTVSFFNPVFFDNKAISQGDINQFLWGSKELRDYRAATGQEGLWSSMFSGIPAYMVNLDWSDEPIVAMKKILSLFLPHPTQMLIVSGYLTKYSRTWRSQFARCRSLFRVMACETN